VSEGDFGYALIVAGLQTLSPFAGIMTLIPDAQRNGSFGNCVVLRTDTRLSWTGGGCWRAKVMTFLFFVLDGARQGFYPRRDPSLLDSSGP
jgi:hypothetical protein